MGRDDREVFDFLKVSAIDLVIFWSSKLEIAAICTRSI